MKQFLHKKIPAALMALCLLLALCCQTLAAGRTLVPGVNCKSNFRFARFTSGLQKALQD